MAPLPAVSIAPLSRALDCPRVCRDRGLYSACCWQPQRAKCVALPPRVLVPAPSAAARGVPAATRPQRTNPCQRRGNVPGRHIFRAQGGERGPGSEPPKEDREGKEGGTGEGSSSGDSSGALSALERAAPLPRAVVETLRDQVFGFDTFFVTDQEPYEGGLLFKGNLRGDPSQAYDKISRRLKEKLGDKYLLYLLRGPDDQRPVAVVVPRESVEAPPPTVPDSIGATAFGIFTVFTLLLSNSPSPEFGFLPSAEYLLGPLLEGVPATSVFVLGLLAHEAGHLLVARTLGLQLALPYFIPSWQLGSFGAITRIKSIVPNRSQLVEVASAGPLLGSVVSLLLVFLSLLLLHPTEASPGEGILLDASAFQDSFLVGSIAKLVLGNQLTEGAQVLVSPITLAAWSALLANAINAIPAGELDGARVAMGLFGRQWANRLFFLSLILLGLSGIFNDVALFWLVLVSFLQRGPIPPQSDELSPPSDKAKVLGAATLVLCFLAYCPLPFSF